MNKRPLEGIKVLDFSQVLAAPFCGMLLADLGAEVIKIERPGGGDLSREYGPYVNGVSLYFCQYNRGKKGIAIDMRSEEGKKVAMDLVKDVDIVIENFKSGTLEKLGIGYEEMLKVNPGLIYGSIAGFGTYGPLSHLPCMDIIAAARSGLIGQSGHDGNVPIKAGFSMCDTWAGLTLLRGLSMALLNKQKTGKGCRVDIAMLDCAFYMCEAAVLEHSVNEVFTKRSGNHHAWYAPHGEFAAKDGYVAIAANSEEEWQALCKALGLDALTTDARFADNAARVANRDALIAEMEKATATMDKYDIEKAVTAAGVPVSAVQTVVEFIKQPAADALAATADVQQAGVGEFKVVNTPIQFSKTPVDPHSEAPSHPGSQSREVLATLGYSAEKIEALLGSGAVHQAV